MFKKKYSKIEDLGANFFDCTPDNIKKVMDVFIFKYVVAEISTVKKDSSFFYEIETRGLKYRTISRKKSSYARVILMSTGDELKNLLVEIFKQEIDSLSLVSIDNKQLHEKYFEETQHIDRKLVGNGVFDIYFLVLPDEDMTTILVNKEVYDIKQKELLLKDISN